VGTYARERDGGRERGIGERGGRAGREALGEGEGRGWRQRESKRVTEGGGREGGRDLGGWRKSVT